MGHDFFGGGRDCLSDLIGLLDMSEIVRDYV